MQESLLAPRAILTQPLTKELVFPGEVALFEGTLRREDFERKGPRRKIAELNAIYD